MRECTRRPSRDETLRNFPVASREGMLVGWRRWVSGRRPQIVIQASFALLSFY